MYVVVLLLLIVLRAEKILKRRYEDIGTTVRALESLLFKEPAPAVVTTADPKK